MEHVVMRLVKGAFTALPSKSIVLSMFLVALLVGVSGAGVSGTRVHVPTRSASPASLPGELMMPRGAGPFPAVIILHGCYGIGPPAALERLRQYASWYVDRGYAGLILDSFAPRGVSRCIGISPLRSPAPSMPTARSSTRRLSARSTRGGRCFKATPTAARPWVAKNEASAYEAGRRGDG
jgi:dienelactone hydrolase